MIACLRRALAGGLLAALLAYASVVVAYRGSGASTLDLIEHPPDRAAGFYAPERGGQAVFAWTAARATVTLTGLDRRSPWTCAISFRGARPDPSIPQPEVRVDLDGVTVAVRRATNEFQQVDVTAPARPSSPDLVISIASSPAFVPGPADRRQLGAQVERFVCRPAQGAAVMPPRGVAIRAAAGAGALGAALGGAAVTLGGALAWALVIALSQAIPLATGAIHAGYATKVAWLGAWIAVALAALTALFAWRARAGLSGASRFALACSAAFLYLKLVALLHPAKAIVDAVFHAHRLEWVLDGRLYFTQLSTSATPFPYAIGLYLAAAPWAFLTRDHVMLLRIVVCAWEALACGLLYVMVVRTWNDRAVGAVAVALANLVPVWYGIVGNANLTNAFGQAASLVTVAAIVVWTAGRPRPLTYAVPVLLATLALISHVSALVLLMTTMVAIGGVYWVLGGPSLRVPARMVFAIALGAFVLSILVYWGHFGQVYKSQIDRLRGSAVASDVRPARGATGGDRPADPAKPALGRTTIPLGGRIVDATVQTIGNVGWPILLLVVLGLWRVWSDGGRDRLTLVLGAWGLTCLLLVLVSVLGPSTVRYQQDASEFIGRVEAATYPAAVILAARGAMWAWRKQSAWRVLSAALLVAAVVAGIRSWTSWFL